LPLRAAFIDPAQTTGVRLIHGAADGWPGWYVDRLGDYLLSQAADDLGSVHRSELQGLLERTRTAGAYHKRLSKQVRRTRPDSHCPQHVLGTPAPGRFTILENGLRYELSFLEGYSVGLFLDQRDNRRRLQGLGRVFVSPPAVPGAEPFTIELLNTFAYTCAFSVAAAVGGARVTSLDLSRKYLDWGRRNFELNSLDPECHDFIYGDAFDWMRRLHKKGRLFHGVILDPPTFSKSKQSGVFRAEKDYGRLIRAAVLLLRRGGVLLASTNAAGWAPSDFLETVRAAIMSQDRRVLKEQYFPQPPDFPINREEPGHLKTAWFHLD
jgi:23S rRNA (cytosine1962-C5)-methyltransferase